MRNKHQIIEEPCEIKVSCTVLKTNGAGDSLVEFNRSCQDAIGQCFNKVGSGRAGGHKWVLEADIKGFFDNIAHESILNMIGKFPKRELIKGWLKAGFVFQGEINPTEQGTPQGGVISPLLANIGLHGLETYTNSL